MFLLQSAHILLGSNFSNDFIVTWFLAALSAAGLGGGRLDIVEIVCGCGDDSEGLWRFGHRAGRKRVAVEVVGLIERQSEWMWWMERETDVVAVVWYRLQVAGQGCATNLVGLRPLFRP